MRGARRLRRRGRGRWKGARMQGKRHSEELRLEASPGRRQDGGDLPSTRHQRADLLPLESQVRRARTLRGQETAATRRREPQTQTTGRRPQPRQTSAPGRVVKKLLERGARRDAVNHLIEHHHRGERKACGLIRLARSTKRYQARPSTDEQALRKRLRELAAERPRFAAPDGVIAARRPLGQPQAGAST